MDGMEDDEDGMEDDDDDQQQQQIVDINTQQQMWMMAKSAEILTPLYCASWTTIQNLSDLNISQKTELNLNRITARKFFVAYFQF